MAIEKLLGEKRVPQYRHWKHELRRNLSNKLDSLRMLLAEKSFKRLLDTDFNPLFICGISGSGTTLLSALLDQEYEIELALRESDRHPKADSILWLDKTEAYGHLENYEEAIRLEGNIDRWRVRKAKLILYRRLISYPRKHSIVLDKAPNSHMLRIGKLLEAFPSSRAILIYRDPVEVIEGLQRKWPRPFGNSNIKTLAKFWLELHARFLDQSDAWKQSRKILSYKGLVGHHQAIISLIAKENNLLQRKSPLILKDKKNIAGKGLRNIRGGKITIVKNAGKESRKRMSRENASIIESLCGDMFERLESANVAGK